MILVAIGNIAKPALEAMADTRSQLKILHVIPAVAARYGGPSTAILSMCRALQQQGIELLVASTDADGPDRLPVAS